MPAFGYPDVPRYSRPPARRNPRLGAGGWLVVIGGFVAANLLLNYVSLSCGKFGPYLGPACSSFPLFLLVPLLVKSQTAARRAPFRHTNFPKRKAPNAERRGCWSQFRP